MGDDLITGGVLPVDDTTGIGDFDPNAVESDDFLDDEDDLLADVDTPLDAVVDEDDDDLLDE